MIAFALEDLIGDLGFDPVGPAFRLAEALALAALLASTPPFSTSI